jgi:predicted Zn finger-like uncharacterized protein
MFTVCPKCALTLVVSAADLRVAQGYVRCGRCSSVFNALARLTEERQAMSTGGAAQAAPSPTPQPSATPEPAARGQPRAPLAPRPAATQAQRPEKEPGRENAAPSRPPQATAAPPEDADDDLISEAALEFDPAKADLASVFVEPPPNPQWTAATGTFKEMIAANQEPAPEELPDSQVDVEMDAAFLASMLLSDSPAPITEATRSEPQPPQPTPPASQPTPPASQPTPPASRPARADAPPAAPPEETRPAAASNPASTRSRPLARHAAPHTRPPLDAAAQPPPTAARTRTASQPPRTPRAPHTARERPDKATALTDADLTDADLTGGEVRLAPAGSQRMDLFARWTPHGWPIGAGLALLLLLAQIINHYRDELAASPRFNRPLTALYSALGVKLTPHWDLHAYDVRQLGASVDPAGGGLITVRASIKNAAQQPQPLPLLRVTLQDRFGNRIAARDVAPRFYLPHAMPASSFLSGGQRIDAEMGFVDPGADAVGFEIDACLPARGGGVSCANDASVR